MDKPLAREGTLDGSTPVTVLEAPPEGFVYVMPASGLSVFNRDSAAHDVTFQKRKGATVLVFWKESAVPAGTHVVLPKKLVLDDVDETLEVMTDIAATADEPTYDLAALRCPVPPEES